MAQSLPVANPVGIVALARPALGNKREARARAINSAPGVLFQSLRMTQWGGVLTVRLTVGFTLVVDPVLLETTPLLSTPMSVKV